MVRVTFMLHMLLLVLLLKQSDGVNERGSDPQDPKFDKDEINGRNGEQLETDEPYPDHCREEVSGQKSIWNDEPWKRSGLDANIHHLMKRPGKKIEAPQCKNEEQENLQNDIKKLRTEMCDLQQDILELSGKIKDLSTFNEKPITVPTFFCIICYLGFSVSFIHLLLFCVCTKKQ